MAEIEKDVIFYDCSGGGVTISGGEPFTQAAFLEELLCECKKREIHTALDTTCYAQWEDIERVNSVVDLYLCDLKHMDPGAHERITGASNERILENLRRLAGSSEEMVIRIPIIPGVNDDEGNIARSAEFVSSLDHVRRIDILPYNKAVRGKVARLTGEYELLDVEPPSAAHVQKIKHRLEEFGFAVKVGG